MFCLAAVVFFQHMPTGLRWPVRLLTLISAVWLMIATVRKIRATKFSGKKMVFSLIIAGFFYAALSLICHVFIGLMGQRDDRLTSHGFDSLSAKCRSGIEAMLNGTSNNAFDWEVGWVPRPGFQSDLYHINQQGIRGLREYPLTPPDPAKRILCMGDSFTFGYEVIENETYPHHAELLRRGTEWINLGNCGTCLLQSLLHYRKTGKKFGGKHVVIGFMTDDGKRTVNCFRPFISPNEGSTPYAKPFAKYSKRKFSIEPNPYQYISGYRTLLANESQELTRLRQIDYLAWSRQADTANPILRTMNFAWESLHVDRSIDSLLARPPRKTGLKQHHFTSPYGRAIWHPDSPGFKTLTRLFDLYHREVVADGRIPLIVIIPGALDVEHRNRQAPRQYASLVEHFKAKKFRYLDFLDPLAARHKMDFSYEALFVGTHYQGHVNKELAEEIIKALRLP